MNAESQIVELEAESVQFLSPGDEDAFFGWLAELSFVVKYFGRGKVLHISINLAAMDECGLREIIALFFRYKIEMRQLLKLNVDKFSEWFGDKDSFWHEGVFG